ncbi:MAG: phosphotransferase, partial [Actinomycetota bacterium]
MPRRPEEIPSDLLRAAEGAAGETLQIERYVPRRDVWRAAGERVFAFVAGGEPGRRHLVRDAALYAWAAGEGIPVPQVLTLVPEAGYMIVERVPTDPPRGPVYVDRSASVAVHLARATPPGPEVLRDVPRREPRSVTAPLRLARMRSIPLDRREVASVRRRFAALPTTSLAHGDFHHNNVLFDSGKARVHVVDLEFLGPAPAGLDCATMWGSLVLPE